MTPYARFVPCIAVIALDFTRCLTETEYNTPIDAIVIINEVFPELINGKGKPVGGILPLTTSAFNPVCIAYTRVIPEAIKKEKKSSAREAVFIPL